MARPRSDDPKERVTVFVRRSTLARVEAERGDKSVGVYLADMIERGMEPIEQQRPMGDYKRPEARRVF